MRLFLTRHLIIFKVREVTYLILDEAFDQNLISTQIHIQNQIEVRKVKAFILN